MSQSKVERRKFEKKNRAKIMRRQKIKKIIGWSVFGVIVGCILAATIGIKIYNSIPKYVEAEKLSAFVSETWVENGYSDLFTSDDTDTDDEDYDDEDYDDEDYDDEDYDDEDIEYSDDSVSDEDIEVIEESEDSDLELEDDVDSDDSADSDDEVESVDDSEDVVE